MVGSVAGRATCCSRSVSMRRHERSCDACLHVVRHGLAGGRGPSHGRGPEFEQSEQGARPGESHRDERPDPRSGRHVLHEDDGLPGGVPRERREGAGAPRLRPDQQEHLLRDPAGSGTSRRDQPRRHPRREHGRRDRDVQGARREHRRDSRQRHEGDPEQHHRPERVTHRARRAAAGVDASEGDESVVTPLRALILCCAVAAVVAAPRTALAQDACANVPTLAKSLEGTTIVSSKPVPASAQPRRPSIPAFCEVHATISPLAGSHIGAGYRLPVNWDGKVLGIGGGGFAGNLTIGAAAEGLSRGYAIVQNDLGHESTGALDPKFAITAPGKPNVEAIIDFGHRATHVATDVGKKLVTSYYGRAPQHSYWQGCSTGGRQGLAEIQRYPADYDGVIAGAPVYTPLVYSNAILRVQAFHKTPGSNLLPEHVPLIQKHVLAACDGQDGIADGLITDPRSCTWDPGELACKGASSADCLTQAQVDTVRRVYAGVKTKDGAFAAMPLMRGGESDWVARMIGTREQPRGLNAMLGAPFVSYIVKNDPSYDLMTFDPERDMKALSSGLASDVHQQNPDSSAI